MGPGVPREAQRLVCVCANEFGGAKDRGEHRQAAGAIALNVIVATGSYTRGECNMPKCTLARRSQLALALRRECRKLKSSRQVQFGHPWPSPPLILRPATI